MTSPRRRAGLVAVGVTAVLTVAACTQSSELTLESVGAADLAGRNGDALDGQCSSLPLPETAVTVDCFGAEGRSVSDHRLEAGPYALVLLCEAPGSYTVRPKHPEGLFEEVVVSCPDGEDPAVVHAFELDETTQTSLESEARTSGATVAFLVREGAAT